MKVILVSCFRRLFLIIGGLGIMGLVASCSGVASSGSGSISSTPTDVVTAATTQGAPGGLQTPAPTTGSNGTVLFKAGGISFIGTVKSVTANSLVMSAPDGQSYTLAVNAQTD